MALPGNSAPEFEKLRDPEIGGISVAVACADGYTLAPGRAAAAQHRGSALGLHAGAEAVRLRAAVAIGLKCALGHRNALLFLK